MGWDDVRDGTVGAAAGYILDHVCCKLFFFPLQ